MNDSLLSVTSIMFAASLWAVDALMRTPLTRTLAPASIVLYEHVFGLLILMPFWWKSIQILKTITLPAWMKIIMLSAVSSVGGTLLFTQALQASFATGDFITPLLLQKFQPVIVILLSILFLGELVKRTFFLWAALAIIGGYFMSFGKAVVPLELGGKELVVLLSLGAAFCWATGTILSKKILADYGTKDATFLRFLTAIPMALAASLALGQFQYPSQLGSGDVLRFVGISLSTGAVALLIYYHGLKRTPAHVATIAELMFPLVSILIGITSMNPYGAPQTLEPGQIVGIALLLIGVTKIALANTTALPILITGTIIKGSGDGKKLGFPTANVRVSPSLAIPHGVYAVRVILDGKTYPAVMHFGPRLVYGETHPQCEVHIFKFHRSIYGKRVSVSVLKFIRETRPYTSVAALVTQMREDVREAKNIFVRINSYKSEAK